MTRSAVVTGSASGIGRTTAELLCKQGYEITGIDLADADICVDLGTAEGRAEAVAAVRETDVVVACAGISGGSNPALLSVNYFGVVDLLEGMRPALARSTNPRAVVISSLASIYRVDDDLVADCLAHDEAAVRSRTESLLADERGGRLYSSSKAALARWVRRAAVTPEWAGAGIALNAVAPGVVLTPMTDAPLTDPHMKGIMDRDAPMPLNGYAPPEAVAAAMTFLVSPENTHVTGQVLFVDGGAEAIARGESAW